MFEAGEALKWFNYLCTPITILTLKDIDNEQRIF